MRMPIWLSHFVSGGIAGCSAKTVVAPFDRAKILYQTNHPFYKHAFTSVFETIGQIVHKEGITHLWKGNTATIARIFPYAAVQFMAYEKYKQFVMKDIEEGEIHFFRHLLCGSLAGMTAVLATYPLDLMRARMASEVGKNHKYKGIYHGFTTLVRTEGFFSIWKGLGASIQGIVPYAGVNFSVYETLKVLAPKNKDGELQTTWRLICGGAAGAIGQTVAYPWDVVRRRRQTMGFAPGSPDIKVTGTYSVMLHIIKKEGPRGLYRGITINYWKVTPAVSISFMVYEWMKDTLTPYT